MLGGFFILLFAIMAASNYSIYETKGAKEAPGDIRYDSIKEYVSDEKITRFPIDALGVEWSQDLPTGTSILIQLRFFEKGKWTDWQHVENDIDVKNEAELKKSQDILIANRAIKFQYKALLMSDSEKITPTLKNIQFTSIYSPSLSEDEFNPFKIDFNRLLAGLNIISDSDPKIISRADWGADESLRVLTTKTENSEKTADGNEVNEFTNGTNNQSGVNNETTQEDDFYKQYSGEIALEKVTKVDEKGQTLKWPIEIAAHVSKFIIHHTATSKNLDNPEAAIRSIYYYHAITRKWGDIGYNYIIDPKGKIYEGRFGGEKVVGAHAGRANTGSIGIAVLGNYENEDVPLPVIQSLINLIGEKASLYAIQPDGRSSFRGENIPNILGHRDVMDTSCPGAKLYAKIPDLRKLIAGAINTKPSTSGQEFDFEDVGDREIVKLKPYSSQKIPFALKNTGTKTWDNTTFLVADQNPENNNMISFKTPTDKPSNIATQKETSVAPGETATFEVEISTFLRSGLITFDVTPIFNGKKKLQKYIELPIFVSKPNLSYALYEMHLPKMSLKTGEKTNGWVKLQNTGDVPWFNNGANPIRLGTDGPRDRKSPMANFETRIGFLQNEKVTPGEIGHFELNFVAPKEGGVYKEHFTPVMEGITWLQENKNLEFTFFVEGSNYKAEFVSASTNSVFKPGETKNVWVNVRNSGDAVWKKTGAKAVKITAITPKNTKVSKVAMEKELSPKETGKFQFTLTAPQKEGKYAVYLWPWVQGKRLSKKALIFRFQVAKNEVTSDKGSTIRVALSYRGAPIIRGDGDFDLLVNEQKIHTFTMDDILELTFSDGKYVLKNNQEALILENYPRFVPKEGTILRVDNWKNRPTWSQDTNDNRYRGILEARNVDDTLIVINELPLEDYLKGLAEPAESDPFEKIKALAVVARTYAKYYLDVDRKFPTKPYDASDDPNIFQRYLGYGYELRAPNMMKAVDETKGMVVTYKGALIKTPYFSSSDGRTRSAEEVFGWTNTPYLQSVSDPYCEGKELRGHGVGLSGCGAYGAAKDGKTFEEIIKYYYQGVEIEKVY
ncbi:SpoIID/LytB domain-containing protein [Candidatus Peregrinibacteria bacterium]|nr:SpoIID/LytB domain-containing protein [Candidatus Peregrinibacteria bacterium]